MLHQNPNKFDFIQLGGAAPTGDDAEHELLVAFKDFLNLDPIVRDSRRKEFARKYGLTLAALDQEIKSADSGTRRRP
jgi:hypothetical protein